MRFLSDDKARLGWLDWIVIILILGLLAAWLVPVNGHPASPMTRCHSNLKQLAVGTAIYRSDFDDRLPLANWHKALTLYKTPREMFTCSEVKKEGKLNGYAMHDKVVGALATKFSEETMILLFETDTLGESVVMNLAGLSWRHEGNSIVAYLDTHVRALK